MKTGWVRAATALVVWLGVAALLWALGAWLLFAAMGDAVAKLGAEAIARTALFAALVIGIGVALRSPMGYLVVAGAAGICAVGYALAALGGAPVGMMWAVTFAVAAVTTFAAVARWRLDRTTGPSTGPADHAATPADPTTRSSVETAVASGLVIGGLLVLGRATLELLQGLAELPGASEHWAGDVVMWLVFVLPIPILAGATMLAAARWLWRRRAGARAAAVVGLVAVGIAVAWIAAEAAWFLDQGSYWGSLDDPLLWAPVALLVGAAAGAVVLVALFVRRRPHHTASPG